MLFSSKLIKGSEEAIMDLTQIIAEFAGMDHTQIAAMIMIIILGIQVTAIAVVLCMGLGGP